MKILARVPDPTLGKLVGKIRDGGNRILGAGTIREIRWNR